MVWDNKPTNSFACFQFCYDSDNKVRLFFLMEMIKELKKDLFKWKDFWSHNFNSFSMQRPTLNTKWSHKEEKQSCHSAPRGTEYLRDVESLSAYHSPQNYRKTCHRPSRSGLHHPVSCTVGEWQKISIWKWERHKRRGGEGWGGRRKEEDKWQKVEKGRIKSLRVTGLE